jgi:hypothetical protein
MLRQQMLRLRPFSVMPVARRAHVWATRPCHVPHHGIHRISTVSPLSPRGYAPALTVALALSLIGAGNAHAQIDSTLHCLERGADSVQSRSREVRKGYRVTVGRPVNNPSWDCLIEITDEDGGGTLSYTGFDAWVSDTTLDLDNDGDRDLLIVVDVGGGNRCCRILHAIALDGTPRELWKMGPMAVGVERGTHGTVLSLTHAFYNLGYSMADSPVIEQRLRPTASGMRDITDAYCSELLAPGGIPATWYVDQLTPAALAHLQRATPDSADAQQQLTLGNVYTAVMQQVYCGRLEAANALLRRAVSDALRPVVRANVYNAVRSVSAARAVPIATWKRNWACSAIKCTPSSEDSKPR